MKKHIDLYDNRGYNDKIPPHLNLAFNTLGDGLSIWKLCDDYGITAKKFVNDMIEAASNGSLLPWQEDRISSVMRAYHVDVPKKDISKIIDKINGDVLSSQAKSNLLAVIFRTDLGQDFFASMDAALRIDVSMNWTRPMVIMARHDIFPRLALAELILSTPSELQQRLTEQIEAFRTQYDVDYDRVYSVLDDNKSVTDSLRDILKGYKEAGKLSSETLN